MISISKEDKIFFTKKEVLSTIKNFINNHKKSSFVIDDDEIQAMLAEKAKNINPELDWSTQKMSASDVIKYFWKNYHVRYTPVIFGTAGDYYVFNRRKFFFF